MANLEGLLSGLANAQVRRPWMFIGMAVVITLVMLSSISNVRLEGDIQKQLPQDLPSIVEQNKLIAEFGGTDTAVVLFYINPDVSSPIGVTDIRDPRVIQSIINLDSELNGESTIQRVVSPATIFRQTGVPETTEEVKQILVAFPQADAFFSKDYSAAIMYLSVDVGTSSEKINRLRAVLDTNIANLAPPPGIEVAQTGNPQVIATILDILGQDAFFTMFVAIILIAIFLVAIFRGRGALTILPILLAVIWMYGTMAWFDIPLSFATAGVGAMILGLSVEYDVFYVERFREEYEKLGSYDEALKSALPKVGISITGSALTTMTGFFALLLSVMPMLQNLGLTLGLGIFYSLIVDVIFNPVNVLIAEKGKESFKQWRMRRSARMLKKHGAIDKNGQLSPQLSRESDIDDLL